MSALVEREPEIDIAAETSSCSRPDDYVIVEVVDDVADLSAIHRPAPARVWESGYGRRQSENFADRMERSFPPGWWSSACGKVPRGLIYNRAGVLADAPLCLDCVAVLAGKLAPVAAPEARQTSRRMTAAALEVVDLIGRHGEVTAGVVADTRDMTLSSARSLLLKLHGRGVIVRVGMGRYALPPEEVAA